MPAENETIIRCSSLPEYPDCALRWASKAITKEIRDAGYEVERRPNSIGAAVGSGAHAGVARMMEAKLQTGDLGNATEIEEAAVETMENQISDGVIYDEVSPQKGVAQKQVARLVTSFRLTAAVTLHPRVVERRLEVEHSTGLILTGQTDLIVIEPNELEDYKTGRVRRNNSAQYGGYTRIARSHDEAVESIGEIYHPRVRLGKPQPDPIRIEYDMASCEQQTEKILVSIDRDLKEFRKTGDVNAFMPNPRSMLCSPKYCALHGTTTCRAWKGD